MLQCAALQLILDCSLHLSVFRIYVCDRVAEKEKDSLNVRNAITKVYSIVRMSHSVEFPFTCVFTRNL